MQNRARTGGILSIIAGVFGVFWLLVFIGIAVVMLTMPDEFYAFYDTAAMPEGLFSIIAVFYIILGIVYALIGALAIAGGVFALKKKHWGWALAGAIGGTITFFPCGIPAIIFIATGKPEFQNAAPAAPAPVQPVIG